MHEVPLRTEEQLELFQKLNDGKASHAERLRFREIARAGPELVAPLGSMGPMIRTEMIESYAGRNDLIKESLTLGLQQLAREIGYERSHGLQRLLLDNVLTCWVHLQTIQNESESFWKQGVPDPRSGSYLDRRLTRAQQRFLRACKAVEDSKRKLGPCVQVNVADQQVNFSACATNE